MNMHFETHLQIKCSEDINVNTVVVQLDLI